MKVVTTSWDDGHPKDFKIAELLLRYKLTGTFYIPKANAENPVMDEDNIFDLSREFEIGGHTMNHVRLHSKSQDFLQAEIGGCYNWLSDLLQERPVSFCFPGGVYNQAAIDVAFKSGFKLARTTELLNISLPVTESIYPTTLQVYNHSNTTYIKHLLKRGKLSSLLLYLKAGSGGSLNKLVEKYLADMLSSGGCFHLWGHSWEIEKFKLWSQLEELFKIISGIPEVDYITNARLLNHQ